MRHNNTLIKSDINTGEQYYVFHIEGTGYEIEKQIATAMGYKTLSFDSKINQDFTYIEVQKSGDDHANIDLFSKENFSFEVSRGDYLVRNLKTGEWSVLAFKEGEERFYGDK